MRACLRVAVCAGARAFVSVCACVRECVYACAILCILFVFLFVGDSGQWQVHLSISDLPSISSSIVP